MQTNRMRRNNTGNIYGGLSSIVSTHNRTMQQVSLDTTRNNVTIGNGTMDILLDANLSKLSTRNGTMQIDLDVYLSKFTTRDRKLEIIADTNPIDVSTRDGTMLQVHIGA